MLNIMYIIIINEHTNNEIKFEHKMQELVQIWIDLLTIWIVESWVWIIELIENWYNIGRNILELYRYMLKRRQE